MTESAHQSARIMVDSAVTPGRRVGARGRALVRGVAIVTLVAGAGLIWFSIWRQPFVEADAAVAAGDWSRALDRYAAAEARFNDWPVAQRVFPAAYRATLANQLAAQFRLGDLDAVLERAEAVPPTAASQFWTGSAFFEKSKVEEDPAARLTWLGRASDAFKVALELEPDNWDAVYNYELTKRLFEELKRKPKTPPKQLLELIRPDPGTGQKPVNKVG